jgi:C4-dicarboxylate transporter DctM subunit
MVTAGSLGILMLPSIPKVIYAISTGTSIGALFVAGLIPGIMLTIMLCMTTWFIAKKNGYARMRKSTWLERWKAFRDSIWGLLLVVIIIGGIYTGVFTATEAAAMSAVYSFFIAVFVYKDMPISKTPKVLLTSAALSAMLLYIITNATLFSFLMAHENIPQMMADWMLGKHLGQIEFLAITNVLLLLAGNVMEPSSIILVFAPILHPTAMTLLVNPVHLGILIDVNMEVGLCHPPVGLNLYVASGIAKMRITELTMAVMPWLLTMLVFLVIVTYWPDLSLWLPRHMGMMN